ncbi:MAG: 3-keto-5-aminohexanoate cleavage protein [Lachnospiraceae bacterium]|nr:3-keto-5-aminohexanoate cleavage protein [Lachnospiraceae bacterium]
MYNRKYLTENVANPRTYCEQFMRYGLTKMPPVIIGCAIAGGNQGKESNPNLPELIDEQVQQAYDAWNAGASMVHVHCRCQNNPGKMTDDTELYREVNRRIREKCPDLIINNTGAGGWTANGGEKYPPLGCCIPARPEICSVDITNYTFHIMRKARQEPLYGRDHDVMEEVVYSCTNEDMDYVFEQLRRYHVKPEFEAFDIGDLLYIDQFVKEGKLTEEDCPISVQMCFTPLMTYQSPDMLLTAIRMLPKNCVMNVLASGSCQYPLLTMAMILGCNVRVGMEDGYYIRRGQLVDSNAQLVEKMVRLAGELERPVASCAQAREILGLGEPRKEF